MANSGQYKSTYLTALTDVDVADKEGVGTIRIQEGKKYKYVKFSTGTSATVATIVSGAIGYLATDTSLHTVCTDSTDCFTGLAAGLTLVAAVTNAYYGWIQIGGLTPALPVDVTGTTPAINDAVSLSATDKAFKVDPPITELKAGVLLNATTTTMVVYLTCPE